MLTPRRKQYNDASEQSRRANDDFYCGPMGRDAGHRLPRACASNDASRACVLSQNGAAMRFIGDAFEPLLLPRTSTELRRESGTQLFSESSFRADDCCSDFRCPY
jgi:hypothetical protein